MAMKRVHGGNAVHLSDRTQASLKEYLQKVRFPNLKQNYAPSKAKKKDEINNDEDIPLPRLT
jgi:hypothetical protein